MASGFEMRVGHAERDAAAAELREHYAAGRLTLDELNERLDKTFAAKTRGDLNALMTDLPSAPRAGTGAGTGAGGSFSGSGDWTSGSGDWTSGNGGWTSGQRAGLGAGSSAGWDAGRSRAGQTLAAALSGLVVVAALLTVGCLMLFGIGVDKPIGIVLILAALAFLRRVIFGRRHRVRSRGPRRRRR